MDIIRFFEKEYLTTQFKKFNGNAIKEKFNKIDILFKKIGTKRYSKY